MSTNFEQDIPLPIIIGVFLVFFFISTLLRNKARQRRLRLDGQIESPTGEIPSIEQRVAGNPSWAKGEIVSKGFGLLATAWVSALGLNLLLITGFFKAVNNPNVPTASLVTLGVFLLIAVVFGVIAVRSILRFIRFGPSFCHIDGKAGVLNGKISGKIRSKSEVNPVGDYTVELQCIETYHTGSGKERRSHTKVHWQGQQQVSFAGRSSTAGIPFSFDLPKSPPETADQLTLGSVDWRLTIKAPTQGVDYAADFTVPVFKMDYSF